MKSSSYAPSYKTAYTNKNSSSQVKTFSNNNSTDTNDYETSSFVKIGYPKSLPKQFNNNALLYKTPIDSANQSNSS